MADKLPFLNAYGNISKTLSKVINAATPARFTQDYLATKLDLSGGGAKPIIPFMKRTGFLGSDGVPTELYKRFRNEAERGRAAAEALKIGYRPLYDVNEYIHAASDTDLKGIVVQVTGFDADSGTVKAIVSSFKALREFATFDDSDDESETSSDEPALSSPVSDSSQRLVLGRGLGLSYTINLNLPATSDIAVFDAIFKSLQEHLLK
jgi:hypothetical protein